LTTEDSKKKQGKTMKNTCRSIFNLNLTFFIAMSLLLACETQSAGKIVNKSPVVKKASKPLTAEQIAKNKAKEKEYKKLFNSERYKKHNAYDLSFDKRFETTLFAGPPYVEYVTAVSADIDGTVYVSVDQNGSLGHVKGYGSVITAKDTNGDGKADKFVDFIPEIGSPRGGHIVGGTYYLLHPPYLTSHTDTDGDGVADKEVLLAKGFGAGIEHPRGADHTSNGVRMGIDGWLYVSVGDFGMMDCKDKSGKVVRLQGGGVARLRPDGSELEVYVHNTRNQFDVAISPTMELFTRDNTNDGKGWNLRIHHQIAEADMGYPRLYQNFSDEHLASLADYGGGSGMGCLFLDEPGFPKDLNNRLYTCDWTSSKVFKFDMKANEATYTIKQSVLTNLKQATDIDVDGSSNLYVSDWKGARFKYSGKGVPVSRIFKARLKNYKAPAVPDLANADEALLLKHLYGPSAAIRLQAQRYLINLGVSKTGLKSLQKFISNKNQQLHARVAAIFTLKQLQGAKCHDLLKKSLEDDSIRIYAMKALTDRKTQLSDLSPDLFANYLDDSNPKVRLQAAISLRRLNKYSQNSVAKLIKMAKDSWKKNSVGKLGTTALPHLASRALSGIGQSHEAAWKQYLSVFKTGDLKTKKTLSYGLKTIHHPELIKSLITELASNRYEDEGRLIILGILARLSHKENVWDLKHWWGTRPFDEGPYYRATEWEFTKPIVAAIEKNFKKFSGASQLEVMSLLTKNRIRTNSPKLEGVNTLFAALEAGTPSEQHIKSLKAAAISQKKSWNIRDKAYGKLFTFHNWQDPRAVSTKRIKKDGKRKTIKVVDKKRVKRAQELRLVSTRALLEVLAQWQSESSSALVIARVHDYWTAPVTNEDDLKVLPALANKIDAAAATLAWKKVLFAHYRPSGKKVVLAKKLVDAKEALHNAGYYKAITEIYLLDAKFLKRAKANLQWDNEAVRKAAKGVVEMHKKNKAQEKVLVSAGMDKAKAHALKNKGDVNLGKALFNKQGCVTCHAVSNVAIQKGPYMGTVGTQFTREFLIDSVLNPSAAISQGFPTYMIKKQAKRGGTVYVGFLIEEDNTHYTLMNIAGQTQKVMKENLEKKEIIPGSQMPPGLVFGLTQHEFTSLIEYLSSMK
jgi:putative heme-binding domain-containing protein